jgi:potassium-transporting ATPase KdpC subunit
VHVPNENVDFVHYKSSTGDLKGETMTSTAKQTLSEDTTLDTTGGNVLTWLRFTLLFLILCGLIYPVVTTFIAGALFPRQANGSLIERNGVIVGSSLVGQSFQSSQYFMGRPSAAGDGYNPVSVSGSNWAASNPSLRERAAATSAEIAEREGVNPEQIPGDLIAASGSGIDPHISPEAAALQVSRIAEARGLTVEQVQMLVTVYTERNSLGLGMPAVNVLELNLALDEVSQ